MKSKTPPKTHKPHTDSNENESLKALFGPKSQYPIPASPVIPESSLRQLQQLMYSKQNDSIPPRGTLPSKTMEAHIALAARETNAKPKKKAAEIKADLSDVSLDD